MVTFTINELRARAMAFAKEWMDGSREAADAKLFWRDFFEVFGMSARRLGVFERAVTKLDKRKGFIDFFWPGEMLVEHKSRGEDLDSAYGQAAEYTAGLKAHEFPRLVLVSDFQRIRVHDLEDADRDFEIALADLPKYVGQFAWIAGYQRQKAPKARNPVDIKAGEKLGELHDLLKASHYTGHTLEVFLVRLLFCLFAEDTGIFEPGLFTEFIENRTAEDGSDLGSKLGSLFDVLDAREDTRLAYLDEALKAFPWVNGKLFREPIRMPAMNPEMRAMLLDATSLDWGEISPAILGNIFQSIKDKDLRRVGGEHYTSEENVLKVVNGLFMDGLREEFAALPNTVKRLEAFHAKLGTFRFLDPACGCGNFLVVAYRELRSLELEVLQRTHALDTRGVSLSPEGYTGVTIDKFFGIEVEEYPAQIAQVAMWLVEHQLNLKLSAFVGVQIINIPLERSATILHGNALTIDWAKHINTKVTLGGVVPTILILGNPPFIGSKQLSKAQKADIATIFKGEKSTGTLDYVACWYRKSADYIDEIGPEKVRCAFVSTNSITQGEQVSALWGPLLKRGIHIDFAHRTFHWSNEGKNNAAVHCVIVGFSKQNPSKKTLHEYDSIKGLSHPIPATNINPYLIDFDDILIPNRSKPLCAAPRLSVGNQPIDDGNYLFSQEEMEAFLKIEPEAREYFHPWMGSDEFLNGFQRWCLWLGEAEPNALRRMGEAKKRVEAVRAFRELSKRPQTNAIANTPTRFFIENMPKRECLVIPEVSSERRLYLPMGFINDGGFTLCSNLVKLAPDATRYHFGVLTSAMHMAWMRTVCGRLESRYRYSTGIVYNNFPWPAMPTPKQIARIEEAAADVLAARANHTGNTLADLYDPNTMPSDLAKAHAKLDKAVDAAYEGESGQKTWAGDLERAKFLFRRYKELTFVPEPWIGAAELTEKKTPKRARKRRGAN